MANDRKGEELNVGDVVMIPCVVKSIDSPHDEFCNITVETAERMYPCEHKTQIILNGRQVEVVHPSIGVLVVSESEKE